MEERGKSGDEGLDLILGGGLPLNGINLIMGLPGSGKTLLCQQLMFARASEERPAVYLSTVSEPFEKILRYAQSLSFFDRDAMGRSVFYEDLGPAVAGEDGLNAVTERIAALIKERRPGIIAIDSFKALAAFADDARAFRRFLHELAALLTASRPPASGSVNTARMRRARRRSSPSPTESSRSQQSARASAPYA